MNEKTDWGDIQKQVLAAIGRGESPEALQFLKNRNSFEGAPPAIIGLLGRLEAQINGFEAGIKFLGSASEDSRHHPDLLFEKIGLLLECGRNEEARIEAEKALNMHPGDSRFGILLIDALELLNLPIEAITLAEELLETNPASPGLIERRSRLADYAKIRLKSETRIREIREEVRRPSPSIEISPGFLEVFLDRFSGREGVYAVQISTKQGEFGYRPIKGTLEISSLKKHLAGDTTLGTYLVRRDNTSGLMVFDLDIGKTFVKRLEHDPLERKRLMGIVRAQGERLLGLGSDLGLPLLLEFSGFKGIHLLVLGEEPFPCAQWRAIGNWLLEKLDRVPPEVHWELFPKQDSVPEDGLGNLVKIPLGIHQRTRKRSWFLDPKTFQPFPNQAEAFLAHPHLSKEAFESILGKLVVTEIMENSGSPPAARSFSQTPPGPPVPPGNEKSERVDETFNLRVRIPLPKQLPQNLEKLFAGCNVLWNLGSRIMMKASLSQTEKHVLIYVLSAIGEEGKICLHQLLNQAAGYDPDEVNRAIKAVPPNPMSCAKVRKTLPAIAKEVGCKCQFRLPEGCYPSPVVFSGIMPATGIFSAGENAKVPVSLAEIEIHAGVSGGIDRLMREYTELKTRIEQEEKRLTLLRHRVNSLFDEAGTDCIKTEIGEYRRIID